MAVSGVHLLIYSPNPDADRAFLRDVLDCRRGGEAGSENARYVENRANPAADSPLKETDPATQEHANASEPAKIAAFKFSSIFLGRMIGLMFMRVKSTCAHHVRPPPTSTLGIEESSEAAGKHCATSRRVDLYLAAAAGALGIIRRARRRGSV